MSETKHIVILANSIRAKKRCVAGKVLTPGQNNTYDVGPWIRLTDPRSEDGAVPDQSMLCRGHGFARLLDVVKVPFRSHCGKPDHPEDWWYEPDQPWEFVERGNLAALPNLADAPAGLWHEGYENDSVPAGHVQRMGDKAATLYLIKAPPGWSFTYWKDWNMFENKNKHHFRLTLDYGGKPHAFSVTDPAFTAKYKLFNTIQDRPQTVAVQRPDNVFLCLSLTPEFHDKHYKICATIFEP